MIDNNYLNNIFNSFEDVKVLVVGDVMIDDYVFGAANRISPEAPVPVIDVQKREGRLGGAANVALNIAQLGATPILLSAIGDDARGHAFKKYLQDCEISNDYIILDQERTTTVKTRVLSRNQQILRYDQETTAPLSDQTELLLIDNFIDIIYNDKPEVVIIQDYNKGVLTPKVIANIIHNSKQANIPVAVDPKFDNFFEYVGCTLIKPNLREARESLKMNIEASKVGTLLQASQQLQMALKHQYTVITLSEKGVFVDNGESHEVIPAYYRNIVDVSGAGDTVISLLGLGLALKLDVFATAELANIAAGIVCERVGVSPVNKDGLLQEAKLFLQPEA